MFYIILGVILGLIIGTAIGLFITSVVLLKSNDIGNSKGDFHTFSKNPLKVLSKRDRIPYNKIW
ncbi:MAG: hypothetical protein PUE21_05920 [Lachnospiraceae bacterium]|nr:hypothetical protein [Lachnospiraceae bacterium]